MAGLLALEASAAPVPAVVIQYADAYTQSQPAQAQLPAGQMRDSYAQAFFRGYTHPSGGVFNQSALIQDAYTRGQAYWRDHPDERAKIFSEYGYLPVEHEGVWSSGFEISVFKPSGAEGEQWWMSPFGDGPWSDAGLDRRAGNGTTRIRIVGYLSPQGHYGHLGAFSHEVLVTSARAADAGSR
ncbi:MAG: hypothetical protein WCC39_16370 [Telluria sp.]